MQWCKLEVDTCVLLKEGKTGWKSNVFTLQFFSIHQNDSGTYRCRAIEDNFSSESHGIKVIVEGRHLYYERALKRSDLFKNKRKPRTGKLMHAERWLLPTCLPGSTVVLVLTTFFVLLCCLLVLGKGKNKIKK